MLLNMILLNPTGEDVPEYDPLEPNKGKIFLNMILLHPIRENIPEHDPLKPNKGKYEMSQGP